MTTDFLHSQSLFPATPEAIRNLPFSSSQQAESVFVPPLIMVIDDSSIVCRLVETCLKREGYDCISFRDSVEALRWLTNPAARLPKLLFLDIEMPKIDGYAMARLFKNKAAFKDTPIVMLTRRNGVLDRVKAQLVGAKAYITKPFKTQDILSIVHTCLNGNSHKE